MSSNLEAFRKAFFGPATWTDRKDGVPLYLLDRLNTAEHETAAEELIGELHKGDSWHIDALGHMRSTKALPFLYKLLRGCKPKMGITIAHAIYQINEDPEMTTLVLEATPLLNTWHELIDAFYYLTQFKDPQVLEMLHSYRNHHEYLVAYNATRALGLPTEEVIAKFRKSH
ncbi:MAG: hypothetical protein IPN29_07135 [Saprospiraceae bacterium]|nr:hypothetical protein [Saprospiraceae bacterium]